MKQLNPLAKEGKINEDANVRDRQSIIINSPTENVWKLLADVEDWQHWNHDIKIDRYSSTEEGETFKWQIKGHSILSTFQKVDAPRLLAWTSKSQMQKAVNVWKLENAGNQTIVSVEVSVQGLSTFFYSHQKLHSSLLSWLSRLKLKAES
ncbi:MAG: SRPBCC family protein [Bacteroidota bacterium]